ncbi:hypothetical protein [Alsobacter sp. R-9]
MASPDNYSLLRAILYFKKEGTGSYVDLGNAPEIELTLSIDKLEHFSSRTGTKTKDKVIVREKSGTIRMVLEEHTAANLALWALDENYPGSGAVNIFASNSIEGSILVVGTNEVGNKFEWELLSVSLNPSNSINLISGDDIARIEITGDVLAVDGAFGTITPILPT